MAKTEKILELNASLLNKNNEQFNYQNKNLQSKSVNKLASDLETNKEEANKVNNIEIKTLFNNIIDAISDNYETMGKLNKVEDDFFIDSNIEKNKVDNKFLDNLTSKVKDISNNFNDVKFNEDIANVSVMVMLGQILLIILKLMESTFKFQDIRRQQTINNINFVNETINQLLDNAKDILASSKSQANSVLYKSMIDGIVGCITSGVEVYVTRNIVNSYLSNQKLQMNSIKEHMSNAINTRNEQIDFNNLPNEIKDKVIGSIGKKLNKTENPNIDQLQEWLNDHKEQVRAGIKPDDSKLEEKFNKQNKTKKEHLELANLLAKKSKSIHDNSSNLNEIITRKDSTSSNKKLNINSKLLSEPLIANKLHLQGLPTDAYVEIVQTENTVKFTINDKVFEFERNSNQQFELKDGFKPVAFNAGQPLQINFNGKVTYTGNELSSMLNNISVRENLGLDFNDNFKEAIKIQFGLSYFNDNHSIPFVEFSDKEFMVLQSNKEQTGRITIQAMLYNESNPNGKDVFSFTSDNYPSEASKIYEYFKIEGKNKSEILKLIEQNEKNIVKMINHSPLGSDEDLKSAYAEHFAQKVLARNEADAFLESYRNLSDAKQMDNIVNVLDAEINHQQVKLGYVQALSRGTQSLSSTFTSGFFEYSGTNSGNQARFDSSVNDYLNNYFQAILKLIRDVNDNENESIKNYFSTICQTLLSLFELMKKSSTAA